MNKLSILFIIIMLALTVIAVIPMFGLPPITYGYGTYAFSITPAMVIIILSVIYLLFTLIAMLIASSVSSHMERSISSLADKLASCQYEKNKLSDENEKLMEQVKEIKEMYEKQLKIIEKVTVNNEKEKGNDAQKENIEATQGEQTEKE